MGALTYLSYHNGLFSPLLELEISLSEGRSISVLSEQYETSYLFYVTLSFLCNKICYLISVFVFSLVTLFRGHNNQGHFFAGGAFALLQEKKSEFFLSPIDRMPAFTMSVGHSEWSKQFSDQ